MTLSSVSLEGNSDCIYDSLTFYDGASTDSPILERVCGEYENVTIVSKSSTMLVTFTSDDTIEKAGFNIAFREVESNKLCKLYLQLSNEI